jgi:hypothetical protein
MVVAVDVHLQGKPDAKHGTRPAVDLQHDHIICTDVQSLHLACRKYFTGSNQTA